MCEALTDLSWVLVSHESDLEELSETYFLYDSDTVQSVLCKLIFENCKNNFVTGRCSKHEWSVVGKETPMNGNLDIGVVEELLGGVPYLRCKATEISDLLIGLERPLFSLPVTEAILWTTYFNMVGLPVPYVIPGWYDQAKRLSAILKSFDLPLSACRWMEMSMLKGYGRHDYDINKVAEKFCRGNGNLSDQALAQIYDSFRRHAWPPKFSGLRYEQYLDSGRWATSGSAGGLKEEWSVDGKSSERRLKKNMLVDWFSLSTINAKLFEQKELRCGLAMKNEVGKARPVVSADPWSYIPMAWVMEKAKDWMRSIPGFFVYVGADDLVKLLTLEGPRLACRGDDIVVTLQDGRVFSFDFSEYDHQIPARFVLRLWVDLVGGMDVTEYEQTVVEKVTELLGNVVLHWDDGNVHKQAPLEGSLASGIRLTTYVGTVVSLGLGLLLSKTTDPWPLVKELNVLYSRSKCYLRKGGEFLRNYFTSEGASGYPCRSVVAILQHKPWLDAEMGRAQASAKARFVTMQRLGHVPPHQYPIKGAYGCPQAYGGYGISREGWDYAKVRVDRERIGGVKPNGREKQLVHQGLPNDVYTLAVALRRIQTVYSRERMKILSGGAMPEKYGFRTWQMPIKYDELKLEYWSQRLTAYEAMHMVNPALAWFVSENKRWGRRQALSVAKDGPEKALSNTLFLPPICIAQPDIYPNRLPGSLRGYYRTQVDCLTEFGVRVLRTSS